MTKEQMAEEYKALLKAENVYDITKSALVEMYIKLMTFNGIVSFTDLEIRSLKAKNKKYLIRILNEAVKNVLMDKSYKNIVV